MVEIKHAVQLMCLCSTRTTAEFEALLHTVPCARPVSFTRLAVLLFAAPTKAQHPFPHTQPEVSAQPYLTPISRPEHAMRQGSCLLPACDAALASAAAALRAPMSSSAQQLCIV